MAYKFVTQATGEILFYERTGSVDTLLSSIQNGQYEISNAANGLRIYCVQSNREVVQGKLLSDFIDVNNQPFADIETMIKYYAQVFYNAPNGGSSGAGISTNVYSWEQLPEAVEINGVQVITLDFPQAFIFHDVDLEGRVIVCDNPNLTIIGFSSETSFIKSTGKPAQDDLMNDVPMITFLQTCAVRYLAFKDSDYPILVNAPSGSFDWTGVNTKDSGRSFHINDALFVVLDTCASINSGSIVLAGIINALVFRDCISREDDSDNLILFEVEDTAVITGRIRIEGTPFLTQKANQTGISVGAGATFPLITETTNYPFVLDKCRFGFLGTPLVGRAAGDGFTSIKECSPLLDSNPNGFMYFENNAITTNIPNISTLVEIQGVFLLLADSQEWEVVNGRLRYKGRTPINIKIQAKASVLAGNNHQCLLAIYQNADYLLGTRDVSTANGTGRVENLNAFGRTVVVYDDEIYCRIGNLTAGGNVTVTNFSNSVE